MKALAGQIHEKMLERYSRIRMAAKRVAVEALALPKAANLKNPRLDPFSNTEVSTFLLATILPARYLTG